MKSEKDYEILDIEFQISPFLQEKPQVFHIFELNKHLFKVYLTF